MPKMKSKRLKTNADKGPYYCGLCFIKFKYEDGPGKHADDLHKNCNKSCLLCDTNFTDFQAHAIHFHTEHYLNFNETSCKLCETALYGKDDFIVHMREVHGVNNRSE